MIWCRNREEHQRQVQIRRMEQEQLAMKKGAIQKPDSQDCSSLDNMGLKDNEGVMRYCIYKCICYILYIHVCYKFDSNNLLAFTRKESLANSTPSPLEWPSHPHTLYPFLKFRGKIHSLKSESREGRGWWYWRCKNTQHKWEKSCIRITRVRITIGKWVVLVVFSVNFEFSQLIGD